MRNATNKQNHSFIVKPPHEFWSVFHRFIYLFIFLSLFFLFYCKLRKIIFFCIRLVFLGLFVCRRSHSVFVQRIYIIRTTNTFKMHSNDHFHYKKKLYIYSIKCIIIIVVIVAAVKKVKKNKTKSFYMKIKIKILGKCKYKNEWKITKKQEQNGLHFDGKFL